VLEFVVTESASFVSVAPQSGSVASGESTDLGVTIDSQGLPAGVHSAQLDIASNDPAHPHVAVPVTLTVPTAPGISVSTSALGFGEVVVGLDATLSLTIGNVGNAPLVVGSIVSDLPEYAPDPTSVTLVPGATQIVDVTFSPSAVAPFDGTLSIASDDPDQPIFEVTLTGSGIGPPVIDVDPTSLAATLQSGDVDSQLLTVSNGGVSDLEFSITAAWVSGAVSPTAVFVTPEPNTGVVPPSGSLGVDVHFATDGLEPGDYAAELRIVSNDPAQPETIVPVTLTVVAAPGNQVSELNRQRPLRAASRWTEAVAIASVSRSRNGSRSRGEMTTFR